MLYAASCGQNLPESYGLYAYSDKGRIPLNGQKVLFAGNLFQSITGLKGASGAGYNSISHFIVFEEDINPKWINLTKLQFKKGGYVQNILGNTYVNVNLWVPAKNIDFEIAPIEGKKDMYKITPKEKLSEGFYAFHFGGLGSTSTIEASGGHTAFDFVIGNSEHYQSYEVLKMRLDEEVRAAAENLLKTANNYFNNREYEKMRDIYKPDGSVLSDSGWEEFTKGLSTWLNSAGKILDSKIINSNITDSEGLFEIETVYEKKGRQKEKLVVRKIKDRFIITLLE